MFQQSDDTHDAGALRNIRVPSDVTVTAEINGAYRPKLKHVWGKGSRYVLWAMTNPSNARLEYTDPTVSKCGRLSRRWGFDGLLIGNSCDYRHKSPSELLKVPAPVSERNIPAILEMAAAAELIIIAHGRLPGGLQIHAHAMTAALWDAGYKTHALRLLDDGVPSHPLARGKGNIPENCIPIPYSGQSGPRGPWVPGGSRL